MKLTQWLMAAMCAATLRAEIPRLEKHGNGVRLLVENKPFVMIGGEAHNSSASDLVYFDRVCQRFAQLNANTIIAPVAWEQFEPRQGEFDATLIDGMIGSARAHNLKLVVLWFGSWKNGVSSYVPEWVKKDLARFPKARGTSNRNIKDVLSTLSDACFEADRKAFVELMRRIKDRDGSGRTVIMVQVQNEIGIRPEVRDRSEAADAAFAGSVPPELIAHLVKNREALHPELLKRWGKNGFKTSGTWDEVFGGGHEAEEVFSVWHYATYTGRIAAAGKAVWPLPMFVNAWLPDPKGEWGNYPSGGPVAHMLDVWRAAAPAIDVFAPDIYLGNYKEICGQYNAGGNPLLIPEHRRDDDTPAKAYWAFGRHHALCFSPFGFESFATNHPLASAYAILNQLMPLIGEAQGTSRMSAVFNEKDGEPEQTLPMDGWTLRAKAFGKSPNGRGGAIIIQTGTDEFIIAGHSFEVQTQGDEKILSVEIGRIEKGAFVPELRLNGDETGANGALRHPAFKSNYFLEPDTPRIFRLRLYRLK